LASCRVDSLPKAKGTSAGIFQLRLLIMYCWSFSSAADCGSGSWSAIGFLSFFRGGCGLWSLPATRLRSRGWFSVEFFASLAEAHTQLYFCFLVNLNARLKFFVMVAHGFRGCSF